MPILNNNVIYSAGLRLEPSSADDIARMQKEDCVSVINTLGSPEGVINANMGSIAIDRNSGDIYRKSSGTSDTGWVLISVSGAIPGGMGEGWINLGMQIVSEEVFITGEDGVALSATNPAFIKFNSLDNSGRIKTFALTSPPASLPGTALTGAMFGTTSGRAWGSQMPLFIYAILDSSGAGTESTPVFACSRNPCAQLTTNDVYSQSSASSLTMQTGFFLFDNTVNPNDYRNSPCVRVGSFRATKSAGGNWSIQALGTRDGIGNYDEAAYWTFPTGQNGADAGGYTSNVDTEPVWDTGNYVYQLRNDGSVDILMNFTNASTPGAGTQPLYLHIPLRNIEGNMSSPPGYFKWRRVTENDLVFHAAIRENSPAGDNYYTLYSLATGQIVVGDDILGSGPAGNSNYSLDISYQAFSGNT